MVTECSFMASTSKLFLLEPVTPDQTEKGVIVEQSSHLYCWSTAQASQQHRNIDPLLFVCTSDQDCTGMAAEHTWEKNLTDYSMTQCDLHSRLGQDIQLPTFFKLLRKQIPLRETVYWRSRVSVFDTCIGKCSARSHGEHFYTQEREWLRAWVRATPIIKADG